MTSVIDLNCDLGEGLPQVDDDALMPLVSSCNIACGGHTGDSASMRRAVRSALRAGVAVGAHPSYPDRDHFGRRSVSLKEDQLTQAILEQCRALADIAAREGARLHHVKPHGALYNDLATDEGPGGAFLDAVTQLDPVPMVYGLAGSPFSEQVIARGLRFIHEGFADRRYASMDRLLPRSRPGAVLTDNDQVLAQVEALVLRGSTDSVEQGGAELPVESICIHSDTPRAPALLRSIRVRLEEHHVLIRAPG